jgi:hypothetical protein
VPDRNSESIRQLLTTRQTAYAATVARCSTAVAPGFAVPIASGTQPAVARLLIETMEGINGYC